MGLRLFVRNPYRSSALSNDLIAGGIPDEATLEDILSEHDTPQDDVPAGDFFEDGDEAAIEAAADDAMEAIFDSSSLRIRPQKSIPKKGPPPLSVDEIVLTTADVSHVEIGCHRCDECGLNHHPG